jgi:hypothetical protein
MTLFKITKLIHDKYGIFINPINIKPKMIYYTIRGKLRKKTRLCPCECLCGIRDEYTKQGFHCEGCFADCVVMDNE